MPHPLDNEAWSQLSDALTLAALRAIDGAAALLREAGRTLPTGSSAAPLRQAIVRMSEEIAQIDDTASGVAEIALLGRELTRLSEMIAERNLHCSPAAHGCARLAEAATELALEALTEGRTRNDVEELSRRARQLEAIDDSRLHVDAMVGPLVDETPEGGVPRRVARLVRELSVSSIGFQHHPG